MNKIELITLGKQYIIKHKCYPAAKGWTVESAGCSRDHIYAQFLTWANFIKILSQYIEIPTVACTTTPVVKKPLSNLCVNCNALIPSRNKYCNNFCQKEYERKELIRKFLDNHFVGKKVATSKGSWLRNFLIEHYGESCAICHIGPLHNNKYLLLEVDHIDGKCFNNTLTNLRFLCPNCHSQTATYKAKNKVSDNKLRYL